MRPGKYHPHGEVSVYDAMVRLAQTFSTRMPLVDGQGNFGNIDGDNPAAMRYTEARLTQAAADLMAGVDHGTVDFRPTYNGEEEEPEIFPGLFPNLLANGAAGIAVGMATSIPPHNVAEIIDAATLLIDKPNAEHDELMALIQGPDFPTGGLLVDSRAFISDSYATGRGSMRVRSRWHKEDEGRGTWIAVIDEIPYGVAKGKLIEQIAQLIADKKFPVLADVRDESDETLRIVLEPRARTVDPQILMDGLFRMTDLESRFPLNLNVLDASRTPRVMGLHQVLTEWLAHQIVVLVRRSRHRIEQIENRLELLDGYIIAYLNLDRVIEIIRTEDEPKPLMMEEFGLTDRQAEAILNMRLRSLRRLEEMELRKEHTELAAERGELQLLVDDEKLQKKKLKKDLVALRKRYGPETARRQAAHGPGGNGPRARNSPRSHDRARAGDDHHVPARLDPRDERPCRPGRHRDAQVQGWRRAGLCLPRPDHRQDPARRIGRALLHARRRQAAGRARLRRAGAADDRPCQRDGYRRAAADAARRQAAACGQRRARLHRAGRGHHRRGRARAGRWSISRRALR